ncbi:MAG: DUF4411 family protein [Flexilinea sp.]
MIYLIDSSVLITAKNTYYPMDRIPEFWEWLAYLSANGVIKIPHEIYKELTDGDDDLSEWVKSHKKDLYINEEISNTEIFEILQNCYGVDQNNLSETEVEKFRGDPFIIAYALHDKKNRVVITIENSATSKKGANRKIPDICSDLGIGCWNTYKMIRELDFKTNWNS